MSYLFFDFRGYVCEAGSRVYRAQGSEDFDPFPSAVCRAVIAALLLASSFKRLEGRRGERAFSQALQDSEDLGRADTEAAQRVSSHLDR